MQDCENHGKPIVKLLGRNIVLGDLGPSQFQKLTHEMRLSLILINVRSSILAQLVGVV